MTAEEKKRRTNELEHLLSDLSSVIFEGTSGEGYAQYLARFIGVYSDGYRHMYHNLCDIVTDISQRPECSLDFLTDNLSMIVDQQSACPEPIPCFDSVIKLFDHVCLEVQRTNKQTAQEAIIQKQSEQINSMRGLIEHMSLVQSGISAEADSTKKNLDRLEKQMKRASSKLKRTQTDIIAVLSIFSAIVLTFSGGLSYISSALSSINEAPFFKSVFFMLVCGFVVFNTIVVLMYITGRMIDVNIFAHLEGEHGVKLSRYVFLVNVSIVIIAAVDILAWILIYYHNPDLYEILNSYVAASTEHNITQTNFNT